MGRSPVVLMLLAALAAPAGLSAQQAQQQAQPQAEEGPPSTLRLSFFLCDGNRMDEALEEAETRDIPVWKELVAEGMVENYGYIVHSWASEWNIGIYTIAESIDAVIKASEEAGRRLDEKYGDAESVFDQACPHHRDGFYTFGPSTDEDEEGEN